MMLSALPLTAKNSTAVYVADKQTIGDSLNALTIEGSTLVGKSAVDAKRTNVTVKNGSFSLRAIAGVNSLAYKNFGYEVTITTASGSQTLTGTNTMAYSAIRGDETLYSVKQHFGYEYACLATVTGLSTASEATTIEIRAYVTTSDGERLYGNAMTLRYSGTQNAAGYPELSIVD
jgi:hypothetical protein